MPFFKTTKNILDVVDEDELFDPNWFDTPFLQLPPYTTWDYKRELKIEDVDIWEVIYEQGGGVGVYAAWSPRAEFYMILNGYENQFTISCGCFKKVRNIETFYGPKADFKVQQKMLELGLPFAKSHVWVDPEDMWLYQD
jgi:hypothetical protein